MRLLRCLMAYFLAFLTATTASANKFMTPAQQSVDQWNQYVEGRVDQMIYTEFGQALSTVSQILTKSQALEQEHQKFQDEWAKLGESFSALALAMDDSSVDPNQNSEATLESLRKLRAFYVDDYARLLDLSFSPRAIYEDLMRVRPAVGQVLQGFVDSCEAGRFDSKLAVMPSSPPLPNYKPDWSIYFEFGSGTDRVDFTYQNQNLDYESKAAKDLKPLYYAASAATLGGTGTVALKFLPAVNEWMQGGKFVFNLQGTTAGAASTIAVYALVAVVVISLISDFENRKKADRLKAQFIDAEVYKFSASRSTEYMIQRYKETCQHVSQNLIPLIKDLENIERGIVLTPSEIETLTSKADDLKAFESAQCRAKLVTNLQGNKCATPKQIEDIRRSEAKQTTTPLPECVVIEAANKDESFAHETYGACKVPLGTSEESAQIVSDHKFLKSFWSRYGLKGNLPELSPSDTDIVTQLRVESLRLRLGPDYDKASQSLLPKLFTQMNEKTRQQQARAFDTLSKLYQLLARSRLGPKSAQLNAEIKIQGDYLNLYKRKTALVTQILRRIFESGPKAQLLASYEKLSKDMKSFYSNYRHVPEVRSLSAQVERLESILRGLP